MTLDDILTKALTGTLTLTVANRAAAVNLRMQLYRWRDRIRKTNIRTSNNPTTEFDLLVVKLRPAADGRFLVIVTPYPVEIFEVSHEASSEEPSP